MFAEKSDKLFKNISSKNEKTISAILFTAIALLIFSKNSSSLNNFSTRGGSTVRKKLLRRCINLKNNCLRRKISHPPLQKNNGPSLNKQSSKN